MKLEKINSIQISLMESQGNINDENKTNYILKSSGKLKITESIRSIVRQNLPELLISMYEDILIANEDKVDSIGIWIDYDGEILENSIKLETLNDMKNFGDKNTQPIYEFFKMSFPEENI